MTDRPPLEWADKALKICRFLRLAFVMLMPSVAFAEESPERPEAALICNGQVSDRTYVELISGQRFALPNDLVFLRGQRDADADSESTAGCPDNPIITTSFSYPVQYNEALKNRNRGGQIPIPVISKFSVIGHDGPMSLLRAASRVHELNAREFNNCTVGDDRVELCVRCELGTEECDVAAFSGRSLPGSYLPSGDLDFGYICSIRQSWGDDRYYWTCETANELDTGIYISVRFNITPPAEEFSVLEMVRALRRQVMDLRVSSD